MEPRLALAAFLSILVSFSAQGPPIGQFACDRQECYCVLQQPQDQAETNPPTCYGSVTTVYSGNENTLPKSGCCTATGCSWKGCKYLLIVTGVSATGQSCEWSIRGGSETGTGTGTLGFQSNYNQLDCGESDTFVVKVQKSDGTWQTVNTITCTCNNCDGGGGGGGG